MSRVLALLCLALATIAAPARAQVERAIQPLQVEADINGVNLTTGQARRPVPVLQIPGSPNLRLERLNMLLPMITGTITEGDAGDYSVNRGGLTSESFRCPDGLVCEDQQGSGSGLEAGFNFGGETGIQGHGQYTEAGSGRRVFFGMHGQLGVSASTGTLAYYATHILYPNGERLDFTYETPSGGGPSTKRPTQVASNLGYVMIFTWRSNTVSSQNQDSQTLAEAAIYAADDTGFTTPLARHSYVGNTVTDLAGRTWSCCSDLLSSRPEAPAFSMRLPGMDDPSFVATSSPFGASDHWVTQYVSDEAAYTYSWVAEDFPIAPTGVETLPVNVTITGPLSYELEAEITVDIGPFGRPNGSMITRVTNALNQQTNYEYDDFNRLEQITYPEGNAVSVAYDEAGNITHRRVHPKPGSNPPAPILVEEAEYGTAIPEYNCVGAATPDVRCWRPRWTEDEANNRTDYTWDAQGNLVTMLEPAGDNGRRRKTVNVYSTFDGTIWRLQRQTICSEPAEGGADDCSLVSAQRTTYTYWGDTFLPLTVRRTNGTGSPGAVTTYAYDDAGRVLSEDGPLSGTDDAAYYRYDPSGRRTWEIGRVGDNGTNRAATHTLLREADDQPEQVQIGRVTSPTDTTLILAHKTNFAYDDDRLLIRERLIGDNTIFAVTQHEYDERNRRICSAVRMNPAEFNSLIGNACALDTTSADFGDDRIRRTTYDELSRPIRIVGGFGVLGDDDQGNVEIEMRYTDNGQVRWREDGNGNRTNYAYDDYDRLRRTTFPDDTFERLSYDERSNIIERLTRAGQRIDHSYDAAGRLVLTDYAGSAAGEPSIAYSYDGQGRETRIERDGSSANDDSLIVIAYDTLGRRESETQRIGAGSDRTVAWQYDLAGRPTRLTWPDDVYVTYEHSPAAQLTAIEDSGGAELIGYGYDVFGRMTRIDRANGRATLFHYDPVARLSRLTNEVQFHADFTYNPASQIATREMSSDNWAWDEGLNVNLTYDVNTLNQYTEVGTTDYAYDLNGNLTDDGPNGYEYDPENRMLRSERGGAGGTIQLRYDGRGRLMRRLGAGDTGYIYDGDAMIAEYNENTGTVARRYIHGAGVDDPLIWIEGAGTAASARRYLHPDERGSIVTVTDHNASIIARNIYDEWGNPGAGNIGRFQYTGQQWLPEIGLYYYKARFYAPGIGRFMQTDPIGYEDGMNLYSYVGNDPMNASDPTGRYECVVEANCITTETPRSDGSVTVNRVEMTTRDVQTPVGRISIPSITPRGSLNLMPQESANGAPARLATESMETKLLDLSEQVNAPVNVHSGYRTQGQQDSLITQNTRASVSPHTINDAADISVDRLSGTALSAQAVASGSFERVNLYPSGDVHVDQRDVGPGTQFYRNWQRTDPPRP